MNALDTEHAALTPRARQVTGRTLAVASVACIAVATLLPSAQRFAGSPWCVVCGATGTVDVVLNVLLFCPLGVGLALAGVRASRAVAIAFLFTAAIETLQFSVIPGRDASLGDILANSLGGGLGFAVGASLDAIVWPAPAIARRLLVAWAALWTSIHVIVTVALLPANSDRGLVGQIGRALGGRPSYPGRIVAATIDGDAIPNTRLRNPAHARDSLPRGALVEVAVVAPSRPPWWRAPIVRIVDDSLREVLLVAQSGADLIFSVGTRAGTMRLRPLAFVAHDVFPVDGSGASGQVDTLRVRARYTPRGVTITVSGSRGERNIQLAVTPAAGWRFFFPRAAFDDGSAQNAVMNLAWLAWLLAPGVYWAARAVGRERGRTTRVAVAALAGAFLVAVSSVAIPMSLGLGPTPVWSVARASPP